MEFKELVPVLQLAIGPVILISGVGLVMLSMTNRYGRVIDRSRHLADAVRSATPAATERVSSQLQILVRRARLLRMSILWVSASLLLAALLIIGLFVQALAGVQNAALPIALFIGCLGSLIIALVVFIYDLNVSLAALELEVPRPENRA